MSSSFVVSVFRDGFWVETPVGAGRGNHYVRTALTVAIPMNERFRVMEIEDPKGPAPRLLAQGGSGDYLVLDNGVPRSEEGANFRETHIQVPPQLEDDLARVRVSIERIIAARVRFEDDQEAGEIADLILAAISAIGVQP